MENSPLKYLTHDLSLYIYERYLKKNDEAKLSKRMLNDQLLYFTNPDIYPEFYGMGQSPRHIWPGDSITKNLWANFNLDKHDLLVSNSLMLSFLRKHYIILKKDKKIIGLLR